MPQVTLPTQVVSRPIPITEQSLVDICDLLGADRFELTDRRVSFVSRRGRTRELRWTGYVGDHLVPCGLSWRITSEVGTATAWASVA